MSRIVNLSMICSLLWAKRSFPSVGGLVTLMTTSDGFTLRFVSIDKLLGSNGADDPCSSCRPVFVVMLRYGGDATISRMPARGSEKLRSWIGGTCE